MPAGAGMYVKFATAKRYVESKYPIIVQNSEPVDDDDTATATKPVEEKPKPKNRQAVRKLVEELREARFSTSSSDDY